MPKIGSSNLLPVAAKRNQEEPHPLLTLIAKVVDAVFSKLGLGLAGLALGSGAAFGVLHPLFFAGFVLSAVVLLIYVVERRTEQSLAIKVQRMIETGEVEDLWQSAVKAGVHWKQGHLEKLKIIGNLERAEDREKGLAESSLAAGIILCLWLSNATDSEKEKILRHCGADKDKILAEARLLKKWLGHKPRPSRRVSVKTGGLPYIKTSLSIVVEELTPHPRAAGSVSH